MGAGCRRAAAAPRPPASHAPVARPDIPRQHPLAAIDQARQHGTEPEVAANQCASKGGNANHERRCRHGSQVRYRGVGASDVDDERRRAAREVLWERWRRAANACVAKHKPGERPVRPCRALDGRVRGIVRYCDVARSALCPRFCHAWRATPTQRSEVHGAGGARARHRVEVEGVNVQNRLRHRRCTRVRRRADDCGRESAA
mmetsp:Transcript_18660/g.65937  ORF Transcript_18660/g.65937 Transcript_18660/m.65937 type:complete len:202 (+) Transcript_18660:125-730(+)